MADNTIPMPGGSPVSYPSVTVGGKVYQLLWGPAARYQLQRYGFQFGAATPLLAYVAAMMGTIDKNGCWKSARIDSPLDVAEMMLPGESEGDYDGPAATAIKNTVPGITVATEINPANVNAA